MKTLKSYSPIFIQALILIAGFVMINAGLANEAITTTTDVSTLMVSENELEPILEDWMTDLSFWNLEDSNKELTEKSTNFNSATALLGETVFEKEIALEEWMTDANSDFWKNEKNLFQTDKEEELPIEEWMTDLEDWNN